jgi:sulfonate transport system permease protein
MTLTHHTAALASEPAEPPQRAEVSTAQPVLVNPNRGRRRTIEIPKPIRRSIGPLLLVALWWWASATGRLDEKTLAGPGVVLRTGWEMLQSGELQDALAVSIVRVFWGLAYGIAAGVALAVIAGLFRFGEDIIDTNVQILRTVPIIGLSSLFIIWFGIDEKPKIVMIAVAVAFPIYINTFNAIRSVDSRLVEAGSTFGLGRLGLIRHVLLPAALPGFLIGLRFALTISWLVLVFAEGINASEGLGFLLNKARTFYETDKIVVVLAVYGLIGLVSDALVRLLERRLLSWRQTFSGR